MMYCDFKEKIPKKLWVCSVCNFHAPTDFLPIRENCEGKLTHPNIRLEEEHEEISFANDISIPCSHRGTLIRIQKCKPCQSRNGQGLEVFSCEVHKECSEYNSGVSPKIQACVFCKDYKTQENS